MIIDTQRSAWSARVTATQTRITVTAAMVTAEHYTDQREASIRQAHLQAERHNSSVRIYAHMSVLVAGLAAATLLATLPPAVLALISAGPAILIELIDRKLNL